MSHETAEEWGRKAAALEGWPGGEAHALQGAVGWVQGEAADNLGRWSIPSTRMMRLARDNARTRYQTLSGGPFRMVNGWHTFTPDPDHPATAGWLERLLGRHTTEPRPGGAARVCILAEDGTTLAWGEASTVGRARIAAAVAYGRWPKGAA